MATSKEAQAAAAEALRQFKEMHLKDWESIQDSVYEQYGVTRRKRLSPEEKAARVAADKAAKAKAKILSLATEAGVRVQFAVESREDAVANVEILQATAPVVEQSPEERYAETIASTGPLTTHSF
jgi:hypothetical protein